MIRFKRIIKSLPKKGEHNFIKIFSLSIGLAASLVMISKVYFENSYDNFFLDKDNIYRIHSEYSTDNTLANSSRYTSGAIAVTAKKEIEQVISATRISYIGDTFISTQNNNSYKASCTFADSAFFTLFSQRVILGDPAKILSTPLQVMITDEMAEMMGGDVIDKVIEVEACPGIEFTIGGVYEKLPQNSHFNLDVLVSMPTVRIIWGFDGSMGWVGNDRYSGYIKLADNSSVEQAESAVNAMLKRHVNMQEEYLKYNTNLTYRLKPLTELHSNKANIKTMSLVLMLLSMVILFAAVMNYILIVISSVVSRSKEVALHKCYGAPNSKIYIMMLSESFVHITLALLLSTLFIFSFKEMIEQMLGRSIDMLFQLSNLSPLVIICVAAWLFSGLLPGLLFSYIPVTTVFRLFADNKRRWKMILLFMQFITAGFLVAFLSIVSLQYNFMINDNNMGYNYDNVMHINLTNSVEQQKICREVISQLSEVADVTFSEVIPIFGPDGGNNFYSGDISINYVDLAYVDINYIDFMQIPLIEGSRFVNNTETQVMVSRSFVKKMNNIGLWIDGAVGKPFETTGGYGNNITVCGVFEDFRVGNALYVDSRPTAMFFKGNVVPNEYNLHIKFKDLSADAVQRVNDTLKELLPDINNPEVSSVSMSLEQLYSKELNFRNSVSLCSLIALLITIMGLIGYLNNEMSRRSKEIAIRKINGATQQTITALFIRQICLLSIAAFTVGVVGALLAGVYWQEMFALKAEIPWFIYLGSVAVLVLLVCIIIAVNCLRISKANPIKHLRF